MPTVGHSEHIPRGEYVVAKTLEDNSVQYIMQCNQDLAYSLFGKAILDALRLNGEQGWILVNTQDWKSDFWKLKVKEIDDD